MIDNLQVVCNPHLIKNLPKDFNDAYKYVLNRNRNFYHCTEKGLLEFIKFLNSL